MSNATEWKVAAGCLCAKCGNCGHEHEWIACDAWEWSEEMFASTDRCTERKPPPVLGAAPFHFTFVCAECFAEHTCELELKLVLRGAA